ncbi:alpha/beta hydrolase [Ramlibacter sp. XY19]|uniref:alpha/beta hydrolase n=1 Tax=Ramlibacter paludis TaxID=2908000 RepID=UPI0023DC7E18|nr:alpha/beta hydrolase [Ramlibacter paludis]MCG2592258.1 alpha/beta hydrolase [Ramlibacter paludis]
MSRRSLLGAAGAWFLSGCSATGALDALAPQGTYDLREGQAYGSLPRQRLDVYLPLAPRSKPPLVVFFYGGAWTRGDRAAYRFVGEALASRGAAVAVADYRLSPQVRWPEILQDCAAATRWVFAHAEALGCDPARIFLMGHSAGAYNAAMLALDPHWLAGQGLRPAQLAGWVGLAGPYDFLPITDADSRVAFDWPNTPPASQPITHVAPGAPRALLLAARKDGTVNPERNTLGLAARLQAAGVPVRVQVFDRVGHATLVGALARPLAWLAPVRQEVVDFVSG